MDKVAWRRWREWAAGLAGQPMLPHAKALAVILFAERTAEALEQAQRAWSGKTWHDFVITSEQGRLQPADYYREIAKTKASEAAAGLNERAVAFVHGRVREEIEKNPAARRVNVSVHCNEVGFVEACKVILAGLGYKARKSYSDSGEQVSIYVEW